MLCRRGSERDPGKRTSSGHETQGGFAMHAVSRSYSGQGAKELFDIIEQKKSEVEKLMRAVPGFQSYTLFRTADGGVSVTVCRDKAGTDESVRVARDWVQKNGGSAKAPVVSEGSVILQLG
jgi:hypothetical protein